MNHLPSSPHSPLAVDFFLHCPQCGTPRSQHDSARFACARCGFTYYFNVASAVAVFIENEVGECLWIRRALPPAEGCLALPGGFTDPGETAEEAARREIREELGLSLTALHYLGSWPNFYHAGRFGVPVLDLFFRAPLVGSTPTPAAEEVSAFTWQHATAINPAELAFPSMRSALAAYLQHQHPAAAHP